MKRILIITLLASISGKCLSQDFYLPFTEKYLNLGSNHSKNVRQITTKRYSITKENDTIPNESEFIHVECFDKKNHLIEKRFSSVTRSFGKIGPVDSCMVNGKKNYLHSNIYTYDKKGNIIKNESPFETQHIIYLGDTLIKKVEEAYTYFAYLNSDKLPIKVDRYHVHNLEKVNETWEYVWKDKLLVESRFYNYDDVEVPIEEKQKETEIEVSSDGEDVKSSNINKLYYPVDTEIKTVKKLFEKQEFNYNELNQLVEIRTLKYDQKTGEIIGDYVRTYGYNEFNNLINESFKFCNNCTTDLTYISYIYNDKGDWITKTTKNNWSTTYEIREIEYYK